MMNDYIIITDSATDMPKEIVEKYNLHVIPTPVVIEGKDYFDGETVFPKEFYQYQRDGKEISTYHINTFMFKEHFRPYAERNETVVYICFSTGLAATFKRLPFNLHSHVGKGGIAGGIPGLGYDNR